MIFDPNTIAASPSRWLELPVQYVGRGRAEFTNPVGVLEGPATVTFERSGQGRVSITPEQGVGEGRWPFDLFHGSTTGEYRLHGFSNPCRSLEVVTDQGTFTSIHRVRVSGRLDTSRPDLPVQLSTLRAAFEATGDRKAAFWVLPLSNFVAEYWPWPLQLPQDLARHPLRIWPTPHVPLVLAGNDAVIAHQRATLRDRLLTFSQGDGTGFIEQLPGAKRRIRRLRRKLARNQLTAVVVGPAHVQRVSWDDFEGLFPIDVLALLTLATGGQVCAPWVEFRDAEGQLVRRCHIPFGAASYKARHPAIRDAIGYLLTCAFKSPELGKKYFRVVLHHAIAASDTGTQESRFLSLCRAFETLCRERGFRHTNLSKLLSDEHQADVAALLNETVKQLRLKASAEPEGTRRTALSQIAERVRTAGQQDKSFGLAVSELLNVHQLADAQVVDAYFVANPSPIGSAWAAVLTHYRNAVTHDAYFDIGGKHDLWEIQRVMDHFHDLLLRVIFKTIGYDGPYHSPIPPVGHRDNADWVRPGTHPSHLGFPMT